MGGPRQGVDRVSHKITPTRSSLVCAPRMCTPTCPTTCRPSRRRLENADGARPGLEIIEIITDRRLGSEDRARSIVHEVISYGFIEPKERSRYVTYW